MSYRACLRTPKCATFKIPPCGFFFIVKCGFIIEIGVIKSFQTVQIQKYGVCEDILRNQKFIIG